MSKKKLVGVAIVLALILLIGGVIAYFTDVTDPVTNVFTLGDKVDIELTETAWPTASANALGMHPGAEVNKNPTINNVSTTTPAYVFMKVTVPYYDSNADGTVDAALFSYNVNSGWTEIKSTLDTDTKFCTKVYAYGTDSAMTTLAANATTGALFDKVTLVPTLTATQKGTAPANPNIDVKAYGIQIDNLGDADTPTEIFALFGNN
jgi:predicted ribosomally synthesized peptide with SipW-like signal peptide